MDLSTAKIGQIMIPAHDLERAIQFYRDTLGMKFLFKAPPNMSFFDCGGIRLLVGVPEKELGHPGSIIYYKVEDIQEAYETLREKNVQFEAPPHLVYRAPDHDLWLAEFRDSEGNLLAMMSEVPHS